jgi:hypothetical protein
MRLEIAWTYIAVDDVTDEAAAEPLQEDENDESDRRQPVRRRSVTQ